MTSRRTRCRGGWSSSTNSRPTRWARCCAGKWHGCSADAARLTDPQAAVVRADCSFAACTASLARLLPFRPRPRRPGSSPRSSSGPALTILPFDDTEQVVDRLNDEWAGLCSSVWTSDRDRAADLARRLRTGTTWVNNHNAVAQDDRVPFGGFRLGAEGPLEFTEAHTVTWSIGTTEPGQRLAEGGLIAHPGGRRGGHAIQRGFSTPDRTTLAASTNRGYSTTPAKPRSTSCPRRPSRAERGERTRSVTRPSRHYAAVRRGPRREGAA
ncbi:aldehyde dehydrogenase family protein [Nocardioides sp. cx-169]|uniref:aldehyde dehydrogenase family protein n=1 Tax=Nocardioides sp. cx-169 TaxID=2899080 RepID=UPI001E40B411|nr:aldehyde dehydrogenase family protein [Nocardioides sp. cx-169]MCD4535510.1 aldehyde dehydrogenase family protein [Nocardioides sp. cx-169]